MADWCGTWVDNSRIRSLARENTSSPMFPKVLSLWAAIAQKQSGRVEAVSVMGDMVHRCILETPEVVESCIPRAASISAEKPIGMCTVSFWPAGWLEGHMPVPDNLERLRWPES